MPQQQLLTLVTGGTGLVGNNVIRMLLERGEPVRALVRQHSDSRPLEKLDVEVVYGDTRQREQVQEAVRGVDRVIHSAAIVQVGRTRLNDFRAINVEGTRHVAQAARAAGVPMIHVSSTDAVGIKSLDEPADETTPFDKSIRTPYLLTKHEAEQVILEEVASGLNAVIVNPSFMLGPWDWKPSSGQMLLEVARGRGIFAPRGYFSVVDVRDVAEGILSAAQRGRCGQRYILAGQTMSYLDAWRLFAELSGVWKPWGHVGPVSSRVAGCLGDLWGLVSGREPAVNSGAIAIADLPRNYSSSLACAELGFQNRPIRQTVEDALSWFREYGYV